MRKETPYIGQMDTLIEVYKETYAASSTGEKVLTQQLIVKTASHMVDKSGGLQENEQLFHVNQREYVVRYNAAIWNDRLSLVIVDNKVKYRVYHSSEVQRNKFLKLIARVYE